MSPTSLSLVSRAAPARYLSLVMGAWLATSFVGNFFSGWLGGFWSSMSRVNFFSMLALIAVVAGVAILGGSAFSRSAGEEDIH